jgi:2'-5' RNA ligase
MTGGATVDADARLRLFVGFPVPRAEAEELHARAVECFAASPTVRVVPVANLHVTVAFLGSTPATRLREIAAAVQDAASGPQPRFVPLRFRSTRSVGMLVLDDLDGTGAALAAAVGERLAALGVFAPEARPWLAHVTLVRWQERPARVRTYVPVIDKIVPSGIAVYLSVLRAGGAQYEILESAALGG